MTAAVHRALLSRAWGAGARTGRFEFELPGGSHFEFHTGQFITLHAIRGGIQYTRAFSIATASDGGQRFELCLNLEPQDDFSSWIRGLKPGDPVEFSGPYGAFRLRRPLGEALAFIATGTGIAPIRAMLQELYRGRGFSGEAWLIFGVRTEAAILYRDEFEGLSQKYPGFHFVPTLSRADSGWPGPTGRVQVQIMEYLAHKPGLHAYVCGRPEMVEDVSRLLLSMGYGEDAVSCEKLE
ncbi:MAG: ferredoxin--NADP reductase [Terriglobia bacterium]